jgi:hypothetical protein
MLSNAFEVAGIVLITIAAWSVDPRLGTLIAGIGCLIVGLALDRSTRT